MPNKPPPPTDIYLHVEDRKYRVFSVDILKGEILLYTDSARERRYLARHVVQAKRAVVRHDGHTLLDGPLKSFTHLGKHTSVELFVHG